MSQNSDRLKTEVDMVDLVQKLGFEITKKGDAWFFKCPSPNHIDSHPSCYTKKGWHNIYCNSCGYTATPIDLVMSVKKTDFIGACDFLAEMLGNPSWYHNFQKSPRKKIEGDLEQKELRLLGLTHYEDFMSKSEMLNIGLKKCSEIIRRLSLFHDPLKLREAKKLEQKIKDMGGII